MVDIPAPAVSSYTDQATEAARRIVEATGPRQAVDATAQVLVDAGVRVYGGIATALAARTPAASWSVDRATVFNLAAEARDRAVSGRLTLAEVGRMWSDFGFPFAGSGTPGEQLLGFLRESVLEGRAQPTQARHFAAQFIAAMALRQDRPADLTNPATRAEDVRLTLLEIELLHTIFERAYTVTAKPGAANADVMRRLTAPDERSRVLAVSDGLCADLQKFYGAIGGKALEAGVQYAQGALTERGLMALGMTSAEVAQFGKYGKMFGALGSALKFVKLAQIYASGQATLTIGGPNPVRKPGYNGASLLVPVKATAGVPDAAWQDYQKNNGSEAYQSAKSCLGLLSAPLPLDLKDIGQQAANWRVSWELVSGSPKHAFIKADVNVFNASFSGNPYTMKLVQAGASAAEATLKVDIREESQLATLFQGPIVTAKVRVRARVQTVEPPSPAVLAGIVSLAGTVGSLVDLGVGWIQAMIPPTTNTTILVEYHDEPHSLDATLRMSMTYDYPHFRGEPAEDRHTITGGWSGLLTRETLNSAGTEYAFFNGRGTFEYGSVSTAERVDASGCTFSSTYALRNGAFQMSVGPAIRLDGAVLPDEPEQLGLGGEGPLSAWPSEQRTLNVACPETDLQTTTLPSQSVIFVAAANAMNLQDALFLTENSVLRGMELRNGRLLADGNLELTFTTPRTVSVIVSGVTPLDTRIVSQNNRILLRPTYLPPKE